MIHRDETGGFVGIRCDKCGTDAPPVTEIKEAFGLINLGWECSGGIHLCPAHKTKGRKP